MAKITLVALVLLASNIASAQVMQRVSVGAQGSESNGGSGSVAISGNGRYVAFSSGANNLVPGDVNGLGDVFVRDRRDGTTDVVNVPVGGGWANDFSGAPAISVDGRYVTFLSFASNMVLGDSNGLQDVFIRDRLLGVTERVSISTGGGEANYPSGDYSVRSSLSGDGRFICFGSSADNLVPGDTNGSPDVFVRDRLTGTTERVSVSTGGMQADAGAVLWNSISADGRFISFSSDSTNLVNGDVNGRRDVFVRDRLVGTTELVSVSFLGMQANDSCWTPSISADGRFVAFASRATNLVENGVDNWLDIFVRDRQTSTTSKVTSWGVDCGVPAISADGRFVACDCFKDVFVQDRRTGIGEQISVNLYNTWPTGTSELPSISADGSYVAFDSDVSILVPADTNSTGDVFVRDRFGGPIVEDECNPGIAGVLACPCANPPSGRGRGCDNSAATGGAELSASGGAYVSSDSLVFSTAGEIPAQLSILTQWRGSSSTGSTFGMGIRCTMGTCLRIGHQSSTAFGTFVYPNFLVNNPQVSTRAAALGDPIVPGQSRRYFVYYRDPTVLGGCSSSSTFNSTQTIRVTWLF
jgi:Tol biopolymer transport system component